MSDDFVISFLGKTLHGSNWKAALAKDLDVDRNTIVRYSKGEFKINPIHHRKLMELINKKRIELNKAEYELSLILHAHTKRSISLETRDFSFRITNVEKIQLGEMDINAYRIVQKNRGFELKSAVISLKDDKKLLLTISHFSKNLKDHRISKNPTFILNKFLSNEEVNLVLSNQENYQNSSITEYNDFPELLLSESENIEK